MPDVKLPFFKFFPADFLTDTMAMPVETRGIYITLLCYQWLNGSIPSDDVGVARICSITTAELQQHMAHLDEKFVNTGEHNRTRVNLRLERERQKAQDYRESRARAGRASGKVRGNKSRTKAEQKRTLHSSDTQSEKPASPTGTSPREHPFGDDDTGDKSKGKLAVPLQKIVDLYHEHCTKLPRVKVLSERRKRTLRNRWREDPKRQNLEWWIKYFQYIDRQKFLNGDNDRQWTADFDFVIRQSGMINIIEGKYER